MKAPPPPPPIWTWTGFYVGVQAGAGWSKSDLREAGGFDSRWFIGSGGEVGGTLGWNWQAPGSPWVLGIEGDWSWANLSGNQANGCFAPDCRTSLDWFATVRGRVGYANGPLLFYVTGGVAWASIFAQEGTPPFVVVGGNGSTIHTGWAVGGGLEGALGGGWSLKAEYLYLALGRDVQFVQVAPFGATSIDLNAHILRAGVNYKF